MPSHVLRNKHVTQRSVIVEGSVIEEVKSYIHVYCIYLGQRVGRVEIDVGNEINSGIQAGWKSFNVHKIILKSGIHVHVPNSLKKNLYNLVCCQQ